MRQLIRLRWIAVAGQLLTIAFAYYGLHINLPFLPLLTVIGLLVVINLTGFTISWRKGISRAEIFMALLLDIAALTSQLYFTGGASNPFISLYLLQIVLGCILLGARAAWLLVFIAGVCFLGLMLWHEPLALPANLADNWFLLYTEGGMACFILVAALLVWFVSRIHDNLRALDGSLATMRQRAAEEDLIVRMGLLASGAAHELGTPLSSIAVILSDWKRDPAINGDRDRLQEIVDMQTEVQRCKSIVTGILLAAGEARGESPATTTINAFMDSLAANWHATRPDAVFEYRNHFGTDMAIVSDPVLEKVIFNVLDNAYEASPAGVGFTVERAGKALTLNITDSGQGFSEQMLEQFGKPYQSSKGRPGGGLGLFLVVNVMRKLGGDTHAFNRPEGGACVVMTLPLDILSMHGDNHDG